MSKFTTKLSKNTAQYGVVTFELEVFGEWLTYRNLDLNNLEFTTETYESTAEALQEYDKRLEQYQSEGWVVTL